MSASLTLNTPSHWSRHSTFDQFNSHGQSQFQPRSQPEWLVGSLKSQAPPALWAKYPNKPYIEEFVPPNPPQALGEGKGKMLVWPTASMCHGMPAHSSASGSETRQNGRDDVIPFQHQSFFRRQVLKHEQKVSENSECESRSMSSKKDTGIQQDNKQDMWCAFDQRSPSAGTTSSGSCHRRSSSKSLGKRRRGHIGRLPPGYSTQNVMIHTQDSSTGHISSTHRECDLPDDLSSQLPEMVRPSNPEQRRATLMAMEPMILYVEFLCPDVCRTRGICVHFSFVLGGKHAPDGLICQFCRAKGNEKALHAERLCARHNNRKLSSFTVNLAEDILTTDSQSVRAHEILARSLTCDWDGVSSRMGSKTKYAVSGQIVSTLPIGTITRAATNCDVAVSSIEPVFEDEEKIPKRVKLDNEDEESKLDDSTNSGNNAAQSSMSPDEQHFMFDQEYTGDLKALMDDANQEFNDSCA